MWKITDMVAQDDRRTLVIALSVLLLTSLFALTGNGNSLVNAEESDEVQLITSQSSESGDVVAASGSNRLVIWVDSTPGNNDIFFKRSTDNGGTWKATVNLSSNSGSSEGPRLVVQGAYLYVIWLQYNAAGDLSDVYYRRSTDNGATWGARTNISTSGTVYDFVLAVSGNYVYIAFISDDKMYFKRSSNNGASFSARVSLEDDRGVSTNANLAITARGTHVYVAWEHDELAPVIRHSSNNGGAWGPIVDLPGSYQYGIFDMNLATTGSYVYAVWVEGHGCGGENEILFTRSTNNGATWSSDTSIAGYCTDSGYLVSFHALAVSGSRIFVFLEDEEGDYGGRDIFVKRSTDNGKTWKARVNLSNNAGDSRWNHVALEGSNVYVIWTQLNVAETLSDVYLRRSTDGGSTWKTTKNISNNAGWSENGQVAVSGSSVYLTWEDATDGDVEILFKRSTDGGTTLKPVVNISNNGGASTGPRIMTIATNIFIVWTDSSPGNNDVLHRRSTDNGATWKTKQNLSNNAGGSESPQIVG
jgi:hypothetical protein